MTRKYVRPNDQSDERSSKLGKKKNSMVTTGGTMPVVVDSSIRANNESHLQTQSVITAGINPAEHNIIQEINQEEDISQLNSVHKELSQQPESVEAVPTGEVSRNVDSEEHKDRILMVNEEDSIISAAGQPSQILSSSNEMPSDEDLEAFRIVFELFDRDRSGFIDNHDLSAIS